MEIKASTDSKDEISHSTTLRDLDQAYYYLQRTGANVEADVNLRSLRRKIDWRIVPLMFCAYTMQFIDKVLLNVRRILPLIVCSIKRPLSHPEAWFYIERDYQPCRNDTISSPKRKIGS